MSKSRASLPFREKVELFLLHGSGQVVAQDRGTFCMLAGGGIDAGESHITSGKREAMEEAGATATDLRYLVTVDFIWHAAWANSAKRKARYAQFQGERVHVYVGRCTKLQKPTSTEGDAWKGKRTMSIAECIRLMTKYGEKDPPNTYAYRTAQLSALRVLTMCRQ